MKPLIIILLPILNGIFAMYEIALVSSSGARLETLVSRGNESAREVLEQLERPEKFPSTIQIGTTPIGIISGAYDGVVTAGDIVPLFTMILEAEPHTKDLAMITTVVITTYLSLIVGELAPRSIALSNPERYATLLSPIMILLIKTSYPFVWLLSISTRLLNELIGLKSEKRLMIQERLKMILRQSSKQGAIDKEETGTLRNVSRFLDKRANKLMTHRRDPIVLCTTDNREKVLQTTEDKHFSKYLLIDDDTEEIASAVSVKDTVLTVGTEQESDLKEITRPALFIPESLYVRKVLGLFKKNKNKFGVVVNEYGSTEGIITLHDLVGSIFGNTLEEDDIEEKGIIHRRDGSLLVEASVNIGDSIEEMGIPSYDNIESEDFVTLGRLVMFLVGRIPKAGGIFIYKNL